MANDLPKDKKLVLIGEAAQVLGVSIDTVRRWDKAGILHSQRPDGKNRYFSIEELEKVKLSQPLTISQTSKKLGLSQTTLRRLDRKGLIDAKRNERGERIYTKDSLESYLNSQYFLRQKAVEEKILEPLAVESEVLSTQAPIDPSHKILSIIQQETKEEVGRLKQFKKSFYIAGLSLGTGFVLLIILLTLMFLLFPESSARLLGYNSSTQSLQNISNQGSKSAVLGLAYTPTTKQQGSVLGTALKPFSNLSLGLVKQINLQTYQKIVPKKAIEDVNDVLSITENGSLSPNFNLTLPDSSYLKIPDQGLVSNLNADYIRGKVPGDGEGNLVVFGKDNTLSKLKIISGNIPLGSITAELLAPGSVNNQILSTKSVTNSNLTDNSVSTSNLADNSVTSSKIKDGEVKTEDLANEAVTSSKIQAGTITSTNIADNSVSNDKLSQITSTDKVAGSAVQLSGSGGLTNNSGLSLLTTCTNNQVLRWSTVNSTWSCATVSGGSTGVSSLNSLTGGLTIAGAGIASVSSNGVDTLTVTATEADTLSSVVSRGATTSTSIALNGGITSTSTSPLSFSSTSPTISIGNTGTLSITDGTNTLLSLADSGTSGTLTVGTITGATISAGSNTISGLTVSNLASANISQFTNNSGYITASSTDVLTNKTISAGNNTISGLTNSNLSGSAGITNANLATSSITFAGNSGSGTVSLGGTLTVTGAGINNAVYSGGTVTITGTEVDTLSSVTGRGATTSNGITLSSASPLTLSNTNPIVTLATIGNNGVLTVKDAESSPNTLLTLTDNGTTATLGVNTIAASNIGAFTLTGNITGSGTPTLSGLGTVNGATLSGGSLSGGSLTGGTYTGTGFSVTGNYTGTINNTGNFNISDGSQNIFTLTDGGTVGNVSNVGTLNLSGAITGATSSNTINSLVVNSGALSSVTGFTQNSGNFDQSGSSGTFSTGTGTNTLNGDTVVASGKSLRIMGGTGSPTATSGIVWYDTTANKFKIVENGTVKIVCNTTDNSCGGGSSLVVRESDTSPTVSSVATLEFGPVSTSSDEFIVTDQTGGVARVRTGNKVVLTDATQSLSNKTIDAGSNTITGLTNSNLSGSAGITSANLSATSASGTYGSATQVPTVTVDAAGRITAGSNTTIAITGANCATCLLTTGAQTVAVSGGNGTNGDTFNVTNTASSGTTTANGLVLGLIGTDNAGGSNTLNALNFSAVATHTNNTFNGLFFPASNNYDNYLNTPSVKITGIGSITGATIAAGSNTISGLTNSNLSGSAGISNANLAFSSITFAGDGGTPAATSLGGTRTIAGTSAQGITTSNSGNTLTITASDATAAQKGVATFNTGNFAVSGGDVTIKTGGVTTTEILNGTIAGIDLSSSIAFNTTGVLGLNGGFTAAQTLGTDATTVGSITPTSNLTANNTSISGLTISPVRGGSAAANTYTINAVNLAAVTGSCPAGATCVQNAIFIPASNNYTNYLSTPTITIDGSGNISGAGTIGSGAITSNGAISGTALTATTGNVAITAGALTLNGTTRISNTGVGTFAGGTVIGSQTFTTNNIADSAALTVKSGGTSALTLDTSGAAAVNIGNTNATSLVFGNTSTNPTLAFNGSGTFGTTTGANNLNGDVTIASGKNLTLPTGTGVLGQTYSSGTNNNSAHTLAFTNSASSGTVTINGTTITPNGTSSSGTNNLNDLLFKAPVTPNSNNFYGLNFETGYTDILRYNSTQIINGSGVLQSPGLSGTYSNALTLSSATNNFTVGTLTATGGTIDNTIIGGSTRAAGSFTSLAANNGLTVSSGGASISGATTINSSGSTAVNIGTGSYTGTVTIGNSSITGVDLVLGSDATGDLYYRNSSGHLTRLAVGSSSQILGGGTTPAWISVSSTTCPTCLTTAGGQTVAISGGDGTTGDTFNVTDTASSGTTAVNGLALGLIGTDNSGGANTLNALNFSAVVAHTNNSFNGLNFPSSNNYTNYLKTPSIVIDGSGNISGAGTIGSGAITSTGAIQGTALTATTGNVAITAGGLTLGGITRISNGGAGTFITGTTIGSQTFTTNNIADSGALTIKSGGSSALSFDTSGAAAVNIGNTNATSLVLGNTSTNPTVAFNGSGTFGTTTGANSLNGDTTITGSKTFTSGTGSVTVKGDTTFDANKSLTLTSGTGAFTQTYAQSGSAGGNAQVLGIQNTNTANAGTTVAGLSITPTNTSTANSGNNTLNLISFASGSAPSPNTTNGISFAAASGYTNFLKTPSIVISGVGAISGASGNISQWTNDSNYLTGNQSITLSGDVTGSGTTAITTTVAKINGATLGTTTATDKNILIANGSNWVSQPVSGDITIGNTGVTAIGSGKVTSGMILDGTIVNADVSSSAGITYGKLSLTGSIVGGDLSSSIAFNTTGALGLNGGFTAAQTLGTDATTVGSITPTSNLGANNTSISGLTISPVRGGTAAANTYTINGINLAAVTGTCPVGATCKQYGIFAPASNNYTDLFNYNGTSVISSTGNLNAAQLTGTVPSSVLGNSNLFVGTTSIALNRASASQSLTGITSIDGTAAGLTAQYIDWNAGSGGASIANKPTLGTIASQNSNNVSITGGTIAGLTGLAVRDASAAFDVTIAGNSSTTLTAGRTLTLDMGNVAHTLAFGTTANTITFPNAASYTVLATNGSIAGLTGTIASSVLGNSNLFVGTTSIALNRASASQSLTGITSIDGTAAGLTAQYIDWNAGSGGASIANKPTLGTIASQNSNNVSITGGSISGLTTLGVSSSNTTGDIASIADASLTPAGAVTPVPANDLNVTFTNISTNASNPSVAAGITITPTLNVTAGASVHNTYGINFPALGGNTCTGGGTCPKYGIFFASNSNYTDLISYNGTSVLNSTGNLNAAQLTGTVPSSVLGNSNLFVGTTSIALNRASASQSLTGITSIDGTAAGLTAQYIDWNAGSGGASIANKPTLGTIASQNSNNVSITGGTIAGLTGLAVRDASAAFDVTIAGNSSTTLTAGRTLTLDMGNVAHTLAFGTTANTITFPNAASYTVLATNGSIAGLTGTIASSVLGNSNLFVGTTSIALNRASASQSLTGITSIDGTAAGLTAQYIDWNAGSGGASIANKPTLGTIASQNSNNVSITGGSISGLTTLGVSSSNTTGDIASIADASLTPAGAVTPVPANDLNVTFTNISTNASNPSVAAGITITPTLNVTAGASVHNTYGINFPALGGNTCTGGGTCPKYGIFFASNSNYTDLISYNGTSVLNSTGNLNAAQLTGTVPSSVLGNSNLFVGTTSIALNRASASQSLTGITSIDGTAAGLTAQYIDWNAGSGGASIANKPTLGTIASQNSNNVSITGGTIAGLTGLAVRDASAAFDVTIAGNSSTTLTAGRTLTLDMGNVAHTLAFGTTANTITFPNAASYTVLATNGSIAGLTGTIASSVLGNSNLFVGTTSIALNRASASQSLTGITSIDGSAATLTTPRAINGTNFDGSQAITITAAAGTLTGNTINSTVTASSLTSVGVLTGLTISSTGANALAVGANGVTTPALNIDASTATSVTGLNIKSAAAGAGLALSVISSAGQANENLTLDAKGSGTITLAGTSTGNINIGTSTTGKTIQLGATATATDIITLLRSGAGTLNISNCSGSGACGVANGILFVDNTSGRVAETATGGAGNLCLVSASGAAPSFVSCPAGVASSMKWNGLTAPDASTAFSLNMYQTVNETSGTTTFTWGTNTGSSNLFTLQDTTGNTSASGYVLTAGTVGTSTAKPFRILTQGTNVFDTSNAGAVTIGASGTLTGAVTLQSTNATTGINLTANSANNAAGAVIVSTTGLTTGTGLLVTGGSANIQSTGILASFVGNSATSGTVLSVSGTGLTTGSALSLTSTNAPTAGNTVNAVSLALTNTPATSGDTFRGINLALTDTGANSLADTITGLRIDTTGITNTTAGTTVTPLSIVTEDPKVNASSATNAKLLSASKIINVASTDKSFMTLDNRDLTIAGHKNDIVIANVQNIFVYDTTKDTDGGRWTNDERAQSSSWYNETMDKTADACDGITGTLSTSNDRCGTKPFPAKSIIVVAGGAGSNSLYIIDAKDNSLWMRFDQNSTATSFALGVNANNTLSSVFALNGNVYVGTNGSAATGMYEMNFKTDKITRYNNVDARDYSAAISARNIAQAINYANQNRTTMAIASATVNDVYAQINGGGKTYIAVATNGGANGGISFITESSQTVANLGLANKAFQSIYYTADDVVYGLDSTDSELDVWYGISSQSGNNVAVSRVYDQTGVGNTQAAHGGTLGPALYSTAPTINTSAPDALYIVNGTSSADGQSNTIFVGHNAALSVIQEKQGDEINGSVKYYTGGANGIISEDMVGDTRVMLPLSGSATLNNTLLVAPDSDVSIKQVSFTAKGGSNVTSVSGVRGLARNFDGTANYLCTGTVNNTCANNTNVDVANNTFSTGMWLKTPSAATTRLLINKQVTPGQVSAASAGYYIGINSSHQLTATITDGTTYVTATSTRIVDDNLWHQITIVENRTINNSACNAAGNSCSLTLYIDGVADGTVSNSVMSGSMTNTNTNGMTLMASSGTAANFTQGVMDEFFFTASAMSSAEIQHLYLVGSRALNNPNHAGTTTFRNVAISADAGNKLNGSSVVKAVYPLIDNGQVYIGTTSGLSVVGMNTDTLTDLYSTSINTTDDTAIAYDATNGNAVNSVSVSKGYGPGILLGIGFNNSGSGGVWLESSNTSIKDALALNYDPNGMTLNQTNLNVDRVFRVTNQASTRLDDFGVVGTSQPQLVDIFKVDNDGAVINVPTEALNTNTAGTNIYTGLNISALNSLTQNGAGGTTNFNGLNVVIPAITQTAGTVNAVGLNITTGSAASGNMFGVKIGDASGASTTQYALQIGANWNRGLTTADSSTAATGVLAIQSGNQTSGNFASGGITIQAGNTTGTSAPGTITIGNASAPTGAANGGAVTIQTTGGGVASAAGLNGGALTISSGAGSVGTGTNAGGLGGDWAFSTGNGGTAGGATLGGRGGNISWTTGTGGATTTNTSGAGGNLTVTLGNSTGPTSTGTAGVGGALNITTGSSLAASATSGAAGGGISFTTGNGSIAAAGGNFTYQGGTGGGSNGVGGGMTLTGGTGGVTNGAGGAFAFNLGPGTGTGNGGAFTINAATANGRGGATGAGGAVTINSGAGGSTSGASGLVLINSGTVTSGSTSGNVSLEVGTGGTLGTIQIGNASAAPINIGTSTTALKNIQIGATGTVADTIAIGSTAAGASSFKSGAALTFTAGATSVWSTSGGNLTVQAATTNSLFLDSAGAGTVSIGTNATAINVGLSATATTLAMASGSGANVITIGNTQTAGSFSLGNAMTSGTISIGGGSAVRTGNITIGSTGTTSGVLQLIGGTGTGAFGGTTSGIDIIPGIAGTINIGASAGAGTGAITIGQSSSAQTVNIANGSGAGVIAIANVQTGGSVSIGNAMTGGTVSIAGGSAVMTGNITIGSSGATSSTTTIRGGTGAGAITLTPGTAGTIVIGAAAGTGQITLGSSSTTQTVAIGNGAGTATITLGTGVQSSIVQFFDRTAAPGTFATNGQLALGSLGNGAGNGRIWWRSSNANYRVSSQTNTLDYSEYLQQSDTSEPGDVMVLSDAKRQSVKTSNTTYDQNVLGVITQYGTGNTDDPCGDNPSCGRSTDPHWANVGMLGQVYTKISNENGVIKPGDPLVTSSVKGVAMKASKAGRILGYALDNFDGSVSGADLFNLPTYPAHNDTTTLGQAVKVGKIIILLQAGWYDPGAPMPDDIKSLQFADNSTTQNLVAGLSATPTGNIGNFGIVDPSGKSWDNVFVAKSGAFANLKVGGLEADSVYIKNLTVDNLKANQIEGLSILADQIITDKLSQRSATSSAQTSNLSNINTQASSSGSINLSNLNVAGLATVSGELTADSLHVKNVTIFDQMVQALESITTKSLIVTDFAQFLSDVVFKGDVNFQGRPTFNADTAGFAIIKKDADNVTVNFTKEYESQPLVTSNITLDDTTENNADPQVLAAQTSLENSILNGDLKYIITRRTTRGFVIKLNKPATADMKFSWSALSVKDAQTTVSQGTAATSTSNPIATPLPSPTIVPTP